MAIIATPTHPLADSYVTLAEANTYFTSRGDAALWTALTDAQKESQLKLATMQIDNNRFFGNPIFPTVNFYRDKQALKFPRTPAQRFDVNSVPDTTHVVINQVINQPQYPDDLWNKGAMVVIEGAGRGNTFSITDFVASTGTFTIENAGGVVLDETSDVYVIKPIETRVKQAVYEQVLFNLNGAMERAQAQSAGVQSYSIGDLSETFGNGAGSASSGALLSPEVKTLLSGLISRIGRII